MKTKLKKDIALFINAIIRVVKLVMNFVIFAFFSILFYETVSWAVAIVLYFAMLNCIDDVITLIKLGAKK